jgi:predicted ferric reductase
MIDNGCDPFSTFFNILFSPGTNRENALKTQSTQEIELAVKSLKSASFLTRIGGIAAFFFAGLTLIVGLYRLPMINKYSRKKVMRFHTILGCLSLAFIAFHIATVLLDFKGWALLVTLEDALLPHFTTRVISDIALGVIGLYLFLATVLTGIFFLSLSKKLGYKAWLFFHRLSFFFYLFVFVHAVRIGTDFTNPYVVVIFSHGLILVSYELFFKMLKPAEKYFAIKAFLQRLIGMRHSVSQILTDKGLAEKVILTSGDFVKMDVPQAGEIIWYILSDGDSKLRAALVSDVEPDTYRNVKCAVKYYNSIPYIVVTSVKK